MKTGILITYHNFINKFLMPCVESVVEHTPGDFEIVLYDNESTHKDNNLIIDYIKDKENINRIRIDDQNKNGGLTGTWNQGIDYLVEKGCTSLILLNHDTIVNESWKHYCNSITNDGIVYGPLTNNPGRAFKKGNRKVQESNGVRNKENENVGYVNGFCFGFTTNTAKNNMIGDKYFNPRFPWAGNESDWQLRLKGIKIDYNEVTTNEKVDKVKDHGVIDTTGRRIRFGDYLNKMTESDKAVVVNKCFVHHYKDNGWGPQGSKFENWKYK